MAMYYRERHIFYPSFFTIWYNMKQNGGVLQQHQSVYSYINIAIPSIFPSAGTTGKKQKCEYVPQVPE